MASKDKACRKFQANIFNKSKCQNCFKAKEAHFMNSEDLRQAKVLNGGWLLLAPDGMNFDNPSHRARKWQRRFFVLFEHGLLRYALDELPSTLPQGTIDMMLCSDVLDAESLTGQSNSLCILSPDAPHAQHFIRTHSRESMQGWRQSLLHFVRSGNENLERKRKEPCLPKVRVAMSNGSKASRTRLRGAPCICPREPEQRRDQSTIPCSHSGPPLQQLEHGLLSQSRFSSESLEDCTEQGSVVGGRKKQRVDSGYFSLERNQSGTCSPPPPRPCHLPLPLPCSSGPQGPHRRPPVIAKFETLEGGVEHVKTSAFPGPSSSSVRVPRKSQSERCHLSKSQTSSLEASAEYSMPAISKSSQSNDFWSEAAKLHPQRPSESCVTPDLLNFKKGWLTKLHEDGTWQRQWFVLTDQSLRFFRDSAAEEAADLDGEIDLSTCYDVTEFSVPRKYGLQVHTRDGAFMLCAMTARIRRSWIQAIEKIVRPASVPNVTCPPLSLHAAHRKTASFKLSVLQPSPLPEEWAQGQVRVAEIRPSLESPEEDWTVQAGSSCDLGLCNPIQDHRSYDCGDLAHKEDTVPPGGVPEEGTDSVDGSCFSLSFSSSPASSCSSMLESEEAVLGEEPEVRCGEATHNNALTALPGPMAAVAGRGPLPPCPRSDSCQQRSQLNMKQQLDHSAQECSLSPAEILALQAELSNTTAKLIAGASTAAQASGEMSVEREPLVDWRAKMIHSEHFLQAQLRHSQTQLEEAEASLQERSREVQELRERLSDVTASLMATEEAQALERERLQESSEKERQCWQEQLAEVEARRHGVEIRLRAAELKVQAQQREHTDLAHQFAEQLSTQRGTIQDLTATIQRLRDEKGQLTSRCQELLNQITAADSEVNKLQSCLKAGEIDKNGLESYRTLYEEFQRVTRVLWEREEQIEEMRGMYERQVEMKQKDLNEALDQVSSLERKLVSGITLGSTEPCAVQRDLQDKLTAAERRIIDLELELLSMQEAHDALMKVSSSVQEDPDVQEASSKQDQQLLGDSAIEFSLTDATHPEVIRKVQDSPALERVPSVVYGSSDPLLESIPFADGGLDAEKFISIIQAMETKLYSSEEKLKAITLKMKEQEGLRTEALNEQLSQWAKLERELCSQLHEGASRVYQLSSQLQAELDKNHNCSVCAGNTSACLEHGWEKVRVVQSGLQEDNDKSYMLSEVDAELIKPALNLRQGGSLGKRMLDHQGIQNLETRECRIWRLDSMKLSAKMLEFEALILKKVAFLVQNPVRDISQNPGGNCKGVENCKFVDRSCMEIMYAEILARKLMAECEFWAQMEKLEAQTQVAADGNSCGCIQTTLENSIQSLKALYDEKFQKLERELLEDQAMLNCQEFPMKQVVGTSELVDSNRFGKGLNEDIHCSHGMIKDDTGPPGLCPYLEQIRMSEAGESSEEMVSKHLQEGSLACSGKAVDCPPVCRDRLATELKIQAEVLQHLSHKIKLTLEMENVCFHPRLVSVLSTEHCSPAGDGAGGSLSMQKNIPDVACKLSEGQDRDLEVCEQAHKSIGSQCPEYCQSVGATSECCLTSLQECKSLKQAVASLREENQTLSREVSRLAAELSLQQEETEQLEKRFRVEAEELQALCELEISQAEQRSAANEMSLMEKMADYQQKLEVLLLDVDGMEDRHEEDVRALEAQFQDRIDVLLSTHQKELERLQSQCTQTQSLSQESHTLQGAPDRLQTRQSHDPALLAPALPLSKRAMPAKGQAEDTDLLELDSVIVLRQRIQELEDQVDELTNNKPKGDLSLLKEQYQRDLDDLKAACERGFAAVEEGHCREIREIRRQHQREVSGLLLEQERLLAEETAATVATVEALKGSHREELERLQRSELHRETPNILELWELHRLEAADGELEVLSVLFSQKCLESSQLAQALESERRALSRCQRENQELDMRLQELNYHLTVELTRMQSSHLLKQDNDVEELVRRKDSEIRCLKREVFSLRNELHAVLRDRSCASDNHRDSCTELNVVKAEAGCDISGLEERLSPATEALPTAAEDDILLKQSSDICRLMTGVRSKSDIEHTWDG